MKISRRRSGRHASFAAVAAAILMTVAAAASAASEPAASGVRILNHENLVQISEFSRAGADTTGLQQKALVERLSFQAFGREFAVTLQDNAALLTESARLAQKPGSGTRYTLLKGSLENHPDSWVRLTLIDDPASGPRWLGVIWDGQTWFSIASAQSLAGALVQPLDPNASHVIYRLEDTLIEPGSMSCGTDMEAEPVQSAAMSYQKLVAELQDNALPNAAGATQEILLSAIGDGPFVESFGADSEAALLARFNVVDGIFSEQVGVQIRVSDLRLYQPGDTTFTESESGALLDQLTDLRASTPSLQATGVTHLFTGRDLDGTTVGVAYLDALCSSRYSTGLSEARRNLTSDALIAAHEIGHNFGAPHDGDPDDGCGNTPETFIMAPSGNGSNQFSACSLQQMQPSINAASCITDLSSVDVSVSHQAANSQGLITRSISHTVRVVNSGSQTASNLVLDIVVPAGLEVVSTLPTLGNCAQAAGGVSCSIAALPAGAEANVLFAFSSDVPGNYPIAASVQADGDNSPANNSASASIEAQPAVDLSVEFSGGNVTLIQNASNSAALTVRNSNVLAASAVTVSVSAVAGMTVNSASTPAGSCTIVGGVRADCQIGSLAIGAGVNVNVNVTGTQTGSFDLIATVNSAEADLDDNNNISVKPYTVSAQAPAPAGGGGDGGGGGGSTDLIWLMLALLSGLTPRFRQ
ncbi:MAG: M12 family metallo-peptidase [Gammaproteobacteria bacterium]